MATVTFTGDGQIDFYGTNVLNDCVKAGTGAPAEQILGLVPCVLTDDTLCSTSCFTLNVVAGDNNSFLFEFTPSVVSADFRLFKQDDTDNFVQVAVLSANEGTPYDLGFSSAYPRYAGFKLDWQKVFNLYGAGVYKFVVWNIDLDNSLQSYPFRLEANTCDNKDGSVYIETISKGLYNNWRFTKDNGLIKTYDLEGLEWVDSCRYHGKVVNTDLEQNIEVMKYSNGREEEFYNSGVQNYDLNLFKTDYELFKRILHYTKGKGMTITNDNLDREYDLIKQNVKLVGESSSQKFPKNKLLYQVNIKLRDEYTDRYKTCD